MKNFIKLFLIVASIGLFQTARADEAVSRTIKVGDKLADFSLTDLSGKTVTLSSYAGKNVVFLNFWATWCASCKEEIPLLKQINDDYKGKGLVMIGIDVKESKGKVAKYVENRKMTYSILIDEKGKTAETYSLVGLPASLIVDKKGIVQFTGFRPPKNISAVLDPLLK